MTAICGCGRDFPKAFGLRVHQRTCTQAPIVVDPSGENASAVAAVLNSARDELLANSTPVERVSPSIAGGPETCVHGYTEGDCDQSNCCDDPWPDDATDPDEPIGNLTGGSYYTSAVQAAIRAANERAEAIANSTPLRPAGTTTFSPVAGSAVTR